VFQVPPEKTQQVDTTSSTYVNKNVINSDTLYINASLQLDEIASQPYESISTNKVCKFIVSKILLNVHIQYMEKLYFKLFSNQHGLSSKKQFLTLAIRLKNRFSNLIMKYLNTFETF